MQKKPYTPPVVTEHGDAVKLTQGLGYDIWEMYNPQEYVPPPPPQLPVR